MKKEIKKEIFGQSFERMEKIEGNVKGDAISLHVNYIRNIKGDEGIEKVEKRMEELGYPFNLNEIKKLNWYPIFTADLVVLVAKEIFNWSDEDIFAMGKESLKTSFILRLLSRYMFSIDKLFGGASYIWKRYFDFGEMKSTEMSDDYIVLRLSGYEVHPLICQQFYPGFFVGLVEMCLPDKKIKIKETKCFFKGDLYHEYLIRWEEKNKK